MMFRALILVTLFALIPLKTLQAKECASNENIDKSVELIKAQMASVDFKGISESIHANLKAQLTSVEAMAIASSASYVQGLDQLNLEYKLATGLHKLLQNYATSSVYCQRTLNYSVEIGQKIVWTCSGMIGDVAVRASIKTNGGDGYFNTQVSGEGIALSKLPAPIFYRIIAPMEERYGQVTLPQVQVSGVEFPAHSYRGGHFGVPLRVDSYSLDTIDQLSQAVKAANNCAE